MVLLELHDCECVDGLQGHRDYAMLSMVRYDTAINNLFENVFLDPKVLFQGHRDYALLSMGFYM